MPLHLGAPQKAAREGTMTSQFVDDDETIVRHAIGTGG